MRATAGQVFVLGLGTLVLVCAAGRAAAADSTFDPHASSAVCAADLTAGTRDPSRAASTSSRSLYSAALQVGSLPARPSLPERELALNVGLTGLFAAGTFTSLGGSYVRNLSPEVAVEGGAEVGGASGAPGALGFVRALIRSARPDDTQRFGIFGLAYGVGGGGSIVEGVGGLVGMGLTGRITDTAAIRAEIDVIVQPASSTRPPNGAFRVVTSLLFGED